MSLSQNGIRPSWVWNLWWEINFMSLFCFFALFVVYHLLHILLVSLLKYLIHGRWQISVRIPPSSLTVDEQLIPLPTRPPPPQIYEPPPLGWHPASPSIPDSWVVTDICSDTSLSSHCRQTVYPPPDTTPPPNIWAPPPTHKHTRPPSIPGSWAVTDIF